MKEYKNKMKGKTVVKKCFLIKDIKSLLNDTNKSVKDKR